MILFVHIYQDEMSIHLNCIACLPGAIWYRAERYTRYLPARLLLTWSFLCVYQGPVYMRNVWAAKSSMDSWSHSELDKKPRLQLQHGKGPYLIIAFLTSFIHIKHALKFSEWYKLWRIIYIFQVITGMSNPFNRYWIVLVTCILCIRVETIYIRYIAMYIYQHCWQIVGCTTRIQWLKI